MRVTWVKGAPEHKYAIKTMKKADIIKSKHVDHIENEKKILERIEHPFIVSAAAAHITSHTDTSLYRWTTGGSCRTSGTSTS